MPKSSMPIKEVGKLSPDGFSRFYILVDVLTQIYGSTNRRLRILDVGGGSKFFEQQLYKAGLQYDLTVLDIIERPKGLKAAYIQGDATNMDLGDKSFDVVVSTDVLEHIPSDGKRAFVDECLRVAGELCIIAAPFDTEAVNTAEVTVNEFNKKLFGSGQDWLEEHLAFGKPTLELMATSLRHRGIDYVDFGTQNIQNWLLNTHINLIEAKLGLNTRMHVALNQFYNQNILQMNEFQSPTYRHFFVAFINPDHKKTFNVARYTGAKEDSDKVATYTGHLMNLLAERILKQTNELRQSSKDLASATKQKDSLATEIVGLRATIAQQNQTLEKYAPLIRLIQRRPLKKVYALLNALK